MIKKLKDEYYDSDACESFAFSEEGKCFMAKINEIITVLLDTRKDLANLVFHINSKDQENRKISDLPDIDGLIGKDKLIIKDIPESKIELARNFYSKCKKIMDFDYYNWCSLGKLYDDAYRELEDKYNKDVGEYLELSVEHGKLSDKYDILSDIIHLFSDRPDLCEIIGVENVVGKDAIKILVSKIIEYFEKLSGAQNK